MHPITTCRSWIRKPKRVDFLEGDWGLSKKSPMGKPAIQERQAELIPSDLSRSTTHVAGAHAKNIIQ